MSKNVFLFAPIKQRSHRPIATSSYLKVMLAMMLITLLWQFWTASFWQVQAIEIAGNATYSKSFIQNYLKSHDLKGQHLIQINPLEIQQQLLGNHLLKDLQVERKLFPTRLTLRVQERRPAFRLLHAQAGSPYSPQSASLIDMTGQTLHIPLDAPVSQPIQVSIDPIKMVSGQLPESHLSVLYQLNQYLENNQIKLMGIFNITDPNNVVLHTSELKVPIWLGTPTNIPRKLHLLAPILKLSAQEKYQIQYVDLRFWKHPVIKRSDS